MKIKLAWLMGIMLLFGLLFTGCKTVEPPVSLDILVVDQTKIVPGQSFTVSTKIHNPGKKTVQYPLAVKVNQQIVENQSLTLAAGETQTFVYKYSPDSVGQYQIDINGQTASLWVVNPAAFKVNSLSITPAAPVAGETVMFKVEVANTGDLAGLYKLKYTLNDNQTEAQEFEVGPGKSESRSVSIQISDPGSYTLVVENQELECKVLKPAFFQASSISGPERIYAGDTATLETRITNIGEVKGTLPVPFLVDGVKRDSKDLTLEPGASDDVSFSYFCENNTFYDITICDSIYRLSVLGWQTYNSKTYYYSISYPQGRKIVEKDPETVTIESSDNSGLAVLVDRVPVDWAPLDYFNFVARGKKMQLPDWSYTNLKEIVENSTVIGYSYSYTNTVNGKNWTGLGRVFKKGGLGFYVVCTSYTADWEQNVKVAEYCLTGFKMPAFFTGTYSNTKLGLSINLSDGWTLTELVTKTSSSPDLVLYSPDSFTTPVKGSIFIKKVPVGTTAENALDEITKAGTNLGLFKVQSIGPFMFTGNIQGYKVVYSVTLTFIDSKVACFAVVENNVVYLIEFNGSIATMDASIQAIEQLAGKLVVN